MYDDKKSESFYKVSKLTGNDVIKIFNEGLLEADNQKKTLYIALGLLGDFDSFEYVQALLPYLEKLKKANINLMIVGIGDQESKEYFCNYTKLPMEYLKVFNNADLHKSLKLDRGLNLTLNPFLNLILMCLGIKSPGTLKEVFRGYIGDKNGNRVFQDNENINFINIIKFKSNLFNFISRDESLRPFELASARLLNMQEVISNWEIYMKNYSHLTQRTGTFLIDEYSNILYSFSSKGLLGFSETMTLPMDFLNKWL